MTASAASLRKTPLTIGTCTDTIKLFTSSVRVTAIATGENCTASTQRAHRETSKFNC